MDVFWHTRPKVKKKKKKKKVLEVAYAHMSRSPFTVGFNSL